MAKENANNNPREGDCMKIKVTAWFEEEMSDEEWAELGEQYDYKTAEEAYVDDFEAWRFSPWSFQFISPDGTIREVVRGQ